MQSKSEQFHDVIRRAQIADAKTIAALTDAAYTKYIPLLGRKPEPMTVDYHQVVTEHHVWLLYLKDQPIGVLVLMYEPDQALIYSVAVRPEFQKQGWGRNLLAWAEQEAQREGYKLIRLYTNSLMKENIKLYRRLGYEETRREGYLGSTRVHMAKRLTGVTSGL